MIVNQQYSHIAETVLQASEFKFYYTGSKFFGGMTEKSDIDFFTQDSKEVRKFLEDNGFSLDESNSYSEKGCSAVYEYYSHPRIHVQVVGGVNIKIDAQNLLLASGVRMSSIPKISRRYVWDVAIGLAWAKVQSHPALV